MGKILLIMNPAAGRGEASRVFPEVEAGLRDMGLDIEAVETEAPGHATELAREAAAKGCETVACIGGDGTVGETGRGLVGTDTNLALIPAGTGNDFARMLGVHGNMDLAIKTVSEGVPKAIDVGSFGGLTFLNTAGVGFDGKVTHDNLKVKKLKGILSYLVVVLKNLPTYSNPHFHLKTRDWEINSRGLLVEFGNGRSSGGGFFLTPDADIRDGLIDVTLLGDYGPVRRFTALPLIMFRRMNLLKGVSRFRADLIKITVDRPTYIHVDGNLSILENSAIVEIRPASLKVLFPPNSPGGA